jgi:hypothetical protein
VVFHPAPGSLDPSNRSAEDIQRLTTGSASYYYRLEVPVPSGQFPSRSKILCCRNYSDCSLRAEANTLEQAKSDARAYLESKEAVEWFASGGIPERRTEESG